MVDDPGISFVWPTPSRRAVDVIQVIFFEVAPFGTNVIVIPIVVWLVRGVFHDVMEVLQHLIVLFHFVPFEDHGQSLFGLVVHPQEVEL